MPALLILLGYAAAIRCGWVPPTDGFQVRDKNRIKSERYLLDSQLQPEAVVVGSSLAANLPTQEISPQVFNLGLAGDSAWTGLDLIQGRPAFRPRIVVVEVSDLLLRSSDREFVHGLVDPPRMALRKAWPMFRTEYQPVGVVLKEIGRWQKRRKSAASAPPPSGVLPVTERLIEQARRTGEGGLEAGEEQRLKEACGRLRTKIEELQKSGLRCVLLDVPGEAGLATTPRAKQLAALFDQEFPAAQFTWIRPAADFKAATWDAVHLIPEDALNYARHLCHELER